jgi:hypothetical protein
MDSSHSSWQPPPDIEPDNPTPEVSHEKDVFTDSGLQEDKRERRGDNLWQGFFFLLRIGRF